MCQYMNVAQLMWTFEINNAEFVCMINENMNGFPVLLFQ
jgi:hypothetical protein